VAFIPLFSELILRGHSPGRFVCGRGALVVPVGRNQVFVPACCTILKYRYMNLLSVLEDDRYLHVWYYPVVSRAHPKCLGASCCVICSSRLGCVGLVSYCESFWWLMYEWCTDVCYSVVLCLCSVWC
jgi:hypothetical protein